MVTGENEEESPWEPLHVQRGFRKEDAAITLFFPNSYVQVLPYSTDAKGILNAAIYNIPPARGGQLCLLINPTSARYLADEEWTKEEIQNFIREHAQCPRYKHWYNTVGLLTKEHIAFADTDPMPLITRDDQVIVVISGKFSSYIGLAMGGRSDTFVTKKVELPADWSRLVEKYKNIVPTYIRY